jgi:ketosteroid isomerase-like protein
MGTEVEDFLAATMPGYEKAEIAIHNGDAAPRIGMWSHDEPVTVFGAARSATGWDDVQRLFEGLASAFSNCTSYQNEIVAAGSSGDLAYIVAFEHTTASLNGAPPQAYLLRVTTVFRREEGEWRVVHRHGDPASEDAVALAKRLASTLD